jgi:hypothetical protein
MSEGESGNGNGSGAGGWTPPYGAFGTLSNTVERLAKEGGIPNQIDRSYLSNLPGSAQTELLQSMRALGLVDEQLQPSRDLELLVQETDGRGGVMQGILEGKYEGPLALGPFATQQQLEDEFRKYGITGNTLRKAIRFFLAAAKYADIAVSPHFRSPKVDATARTPRKTKTRETDGGGGGNANQGNSKLEPAVEHHPLIQGLFQELPSPGAPFPKQKQDDWLELARVTFRMIYKADAAPEISDPEPSLDDDD